LTFFSDSFTVSSPTSFSGEKHNSKTISSRGQRWKAGFLFALVKALSLSTWYEYLISCSRIRKKMLSPESYCCHKEGNKTFDMTLNLSWGCVIPSRKGSQKPIFNLSLQTRSASISLLEAAVQKKTGGGKSGSYMNKFYGIVFLSKADYFIPISPASV